LELRGISLRFMSIYRKAYVIKAARVIRVIVYQKIILSIHKKAWLFGISF